jgi:radical SAM superfamily enzyme YgiQ (UPF0313 family)
VWPFSRPTLVLAHLYAVLESHGFKQLSVFDLDLAFAENKEMVDYYIDKAISMVEKTKPEVLCLSCKVAQFPFVSLFSRQYKRIHPQTKIILGGWMPTLSPNVTLQMVPCDAIIRGEGEKSLPQLLHMIDENTWFVGTATGNLYYTLNGGTTWTSKTFTGSGAGSILDITQGVEGILFMSHQTAATKGRILQSFDGGYSWIVLPQDSSTLPANDKLNALAACSDDPNFVVGVGLADDGVDGFIIVGTD